MSDTGWTRIADLQVGDYFILRPHTYPTEKQVWVRGKYDRSTKKYDCYKWDDICHCKQFNPETKVFTNFIF